MKNYRFNPNYKSELHTLIVGNILKNEEPFQNFTEVKAIGQLSSDLEGSLWLLELEQVSTLVGIIALYSEPALQWM